MPFEQPPQPPKDSAGKKKIAERHFYIPGEGLVAGSDLDSKDIEKMTAGMKSPPAKAMPEASSPRVVENRPVHVKAKKDETHYMIPGKGLVPESDLTEEDIRQMLGGSKT